MTNTNTTGGRNGNRMTGKKASTIKVGDEVMFAGLETFPGKDVVYNGWYKVEGIVPDAMGKLHFCLEGVPGCWPAKKIGYVREPR